MAMTNTSQQMMPASASFSDTEILSYLKNNGTIDLNGVVEDMARSRREQLLQQHKYAITERSDGRWQTYVPDESCRNGRRLIAKSTKKKVEDAVCDYYSGIDAHNSTDRRYITMKGLYPLWIEYKALHVAENTILRIQKDWKKYYEKSDIANKPIVSLTKLEIDAWVHKMIRDHSMNKHKYGNFSLIIRQLLDYAVDSEIIERNPFLSVKVDKKRVLVPEKKKADKTQVFTKDEETRMIEHAWTAYENKENYVQEFVPLALVFMFYTGIRVGEAAAIRYEDIDGDILHVRRMVAYPSGKIIDRTKGTFGDREIPLIPVAKEVIEATIVRRQEKGKPVEGYVFCPHDTPLNTYTSIQKTFTKYCRELGILERSSHKARKTVVSSMLDNGLNLNTVRQIIGHMDEKTTLNNYCYDRSDEQERYEKMALALS
ncbi:MAG: site-specific integrase [Mogibacterium sp.]|nr:site-specific integrase [Mogibacterium sp.]